MRRLLGTTAFIACMLCVGCGSGSQSSQSNQTPTRVTVDAGSNILGDSGAKVTIIEFGDFQCPYCKSFHADTEWQIISQYVNMGKARFAYRQFPLSIHQNAEIAAEASECAAQVGGNDAFWRYHDTLYTNGQSDGTGLDLASLKQYAADLQLDTASFNACLDNHAMAAQVSKDSTDGRAAGVQGVPTFFINGKLLEGAQPFGAFKAAIDAEL